MATQSISNPAPNPMTAIFIPELWNITAIQGQTSSTTSTAFVGQISMFQGSTLPSSKWAWCDGSLLQVSLYPGLFAQIGYAYGGSGVNFALPNCFDKSPYGADNTTILTTTTYSNSPVTANSTGGNRNLNVGQLAAHSHNVTISPLNMTQNVTVNQSNRGQNIPSSPSSFKNPLETNANLSITASNTGTAPYGADFLPPFSVVKYIIRILF